MTTPEYFILHYGAGLQDLCRTKPGWYETIARRAGTTPWRIKKAKYMVEGGAHKLGRVTPVTCGEAVAIRLRAEAE